MVLLKGTLNLRLKSLFAIWFCHLRALTWTGDLISWASVSSSIETDLNQLFSTHNVRAHSISTTWELVRNADPQFTPDRTFEGRAQQSVL